MLRDNSTLPLEEPPTGSSFTVIPGKKLAGEIDVTSSPGLPGDKSLSHRAALLGAMAEGESTVENFMVAGVTRAMLQALSTLDVPWRLDGTKLTIHGMGLHSRNPAWHSAMKAIDCGNSATTMRLLAGALAAWGIPATLDGTPGLRRRPMDRIMEPLLRMGVDIQGAGRCAPLVLHPSRMPLRAINYTLPVASAQVKTCLLLAALAAEGTTTLVEPGASRDHTERMLRAMGVCVDSSISSDTSFTITRLTPPSSLKLECLDITLPGDFSAAASLIVGGLIIPGSRIILRGVGLNPTRTGLLDVLKEMGADIDITKLTERNGEPVGDLEVRSSSLRGVRVNGNLVVRMIDEFPIFAVAAACADGTSIVENAEELRHKESDRISSLGGELARIGVQFSEAKDGFMIQGGRDLIGGEVNSHHDHRLAMSMLVAGLASRSPVTVQEAEIINESFPGFVSVLKRLGAEVRVEAKP